jgi:outer membrane protein assembly factor BamB
LSVCLGIVWALAPAPLARGADWTQWGGHTDKNRVSQEKGLPESFVPGDKDPQGGGIKMETTQNVKWAARLGAMTCSTPAVAGGKVFIGTMRDDQGVFLCLDEATGKPLWQWMAPVREVPATIDGRRFEFGRFPKQLGVCSSPAVDGDRVYFVTQRLEVLCLSVNGRPKTSGAPAAGKPAAPPAKAPSAKTPSAKAPSAKTLAAPATSGKTGAPAVPAPAAKPDAPPAKAAVPVPAGKKDEAAHAPWPEAPGEAETIWMFDIWDLGVRPSDACNCSPVVDERFVYVCTANGVDRQAESNAHDEFRQVPAPTAPNVIVLDKKTGRLVAMDDVQFPERMLHGQWSSLALGKVGGKTLIFFGGGDGRCYAFEAPGPAAAAAGAPVADKPVILKKVWSVDCNPPEYQEAARTMPLITHYCLGDKRRSDSLNKKGDGTFVGMSEIIATPVFYKNRVYIAIGRDPAHGRGRGALWCIDATQTGDITQTGKVWCYQGLDRSLSTVSIADGLLYVSDVAGRLHCLDAETGNCYWVHEANSQTWGSTLVADGKVYMPTEKGFWVLAAGKEMKPIGKINLGAPVWASPVAANGVLYVASTRYLWAVQKKD